MDNRKWQAAASATPPAAEASPSIGYPTDGNLATPTPATTPGAFWFHQIGEEIRAVIAAAGLTPSDATLTQLRDAIQAMIVGAQKAVIVNNATFEASVADGEAVRWDSANSRFDEAIADGTANNRAVGIADVTNSRVYLYGECPIFSGLTPGARYYLDASTPGAITATAPADAVQVGIAKSATVLWVDVDSAILPAASETVAGVMEIATAAEAQAFTANKAIDGSKLAAAFQGSNQSKITNGYQKLPGGLIIQWGITGLINSGGNAVVTFPVAFPNAPLSAVCSFDVAANFSYGHTFGTNVGSGSTSTQMTIYFYSGSSAQPAHWIAIGY